MAELAESAGDDGAHRAQAAALLLAAGLRWVDAAIGTDARPGTYDRSAMQAAIVPLLAVFDRFPELDTIMLPEGSSWPTRYGVLFEAANLLFRLEDGAACAARFGALYELDPDGERAADALVGAVLCQLYVFRASHGTRPEPWPIDATPDELRPLDRAMLGSFARLWCAHLPAWSEPALLSYDSARLYYDAGRWSEAAAHFREALRLDPGWRSEDATTIALLYLDAADRVIASGGDQEACVASRAAFAAEVRAARCAEESDDELVAELCACAGGTCTRPARCTPEPERRPRGRRGAGSCVELPVR